jgi:hypothetical protein
MIANLRISSVITVLVWCLFMGVTAISIGVGAIFPPINYIAGPVVCPGGALSTQQQGYRVSPVESVTTITMYCNDRSTGTANEVGMLPVVLVAGPIYGLLLFLVVLVVMLMRAQKPAPANESNDWLSLTGKARSGNGLLTPAARAEMERNQFSTDSSSVDAKIEVLNELHDAKQISDGVYQKRKQELLSKTTRPGK